MVLASSELATPLAGPVRHRALIAALRRHRSVSGTQREKGSHECPAGVLPCVVAGA